MGAQVVPAHAASITVARCGGHQVASQADHVRHDHPLDTAHPSLARHQCGRHVLRSEPRPPPARRARGVLHALRRFKRVHGHRGDLPYRDARRPCVPASVRRGLARAHRAPLDGYLDCRLLELPLAPDPPAHLHRVWRAPRRCAPRAAGRAARRVWRVRRVAPHWCVGAWEGGGIQQLWRFLCSHGRRRGARTPLAAHNRQTGAGFLGLDVDDGVDSIVGHGYARWVGTTRHLWVRLLPAWSKSGETDRRRYHCHHREQLTNDIYLHHHRGETLFNTPNCMPLSVGTCTYNN
jgi:hypothetical protein